MSTKNNFYIILLIIALIAGLIFYYIYSYYNFNSKSKLSYQLNNYPINSESSLIYINKEKVLFTPKHSLVIVSITTSPRRIKLMKNTLDSILSQTHPPDIIRINIPITFKRTGHTYDIPDFIKNNSKIKVYQYNEDFGPIMKILPTIMDCNENNNNHVIYIDDDVLMLQNTIETFLDYINQNPNYVYCISGFNFTGQNKWIRTYEPGFVNIPEGYMSVCLSSSVINKINKNYSILNYYNFFSKDEYCFTSDDLMIGNFFAMNNIFIFKISNHKISFELWWQSGCELKYGKDGDGIMHLEQDQHFTRYNKAFKYINDNQMNFILKT